MKANQTIGTRTALPTLLPTVSSVVLSLIPSTSKAIFNTLFRTGTPMVRQPRYNGLVERAMAERGFRHLGRLACCGSLSPG